MSPTPFKSDSSALLSEDSSQPVFSKVLIANRGAIAVRIIRTLKKMGIISVAVYSKADTDSLHVSLADETYYLGEGNAADTYLNQDKLFSILKTSQAEAVHPGYGFLSENPEFVERCEAENIIFIGPTAEQMRIFGLKHTARSVAEKNNVPLLAGTALLSSITEAIEAANNIGYPVILKSTAGGGGIGMQICHDDKELSDAFDSVKRLSANNFSNDGVFLEKYIARARHIEVQVFGDGEGFAVALGERDCSAQRRHQKVLEETPAPNLTETTRQSLYDVATRLVSDVNYRNAGTVEFIYDDANAEFYFLEVNTRLQVEHGVTEAVYGIDLVEWMTLQAAEKFSQLKQKSSTFLSSLKPKGHAIQARIYAENPHKQFLPSAGLLSEVNFPSNHLDSSSSDNIVRIDHWIRTGLEVSSFYDPMLGKVICSAPSREEAMSQLNLTLNDITIQGIETNIDYVKSILHTDIFQAGNIFTRYLNEFIYSPATIDVLAAGTMTTIQDYPGRTGYWSVGVPPSGAFDNFSFRLGQKLLSNFCRAIDLDIQDEHSFAGLEVTHNGPTLQFNCPTYFILCGADVDASLEVNPSLEANPCLDVELKEEKINKAIDSCRVYSASSGDVLKVGRLKDAGARTYILFAGGLEANNYLGSHSTFTLGQFGGFSGRALRTGDVLHLDNALTQTIQKNALTVPKEFETSHKLLPTFQNHWQLHVIYGPHGAPDFFTTKDIEVFFSASWKVHYNSSRTGIRLIGPKPEWARTTGGEAGMHPSNIHDNAYAIGSIDFTGDMPVILGPDGPSLGGFVCPATVIHADLWKLGQLKAGDTIEFIAVSQSTAQQLEKEQRQFIETLDINNCPALSYALLNSDIKKQTLKPAEIETLEPKQLAATSPVHATLADENVNESTSDSDNNFDVDIVIRPAGDKYLLVEFGPLVLDLRLRFRVHALMLWIENANIDGVLELTPGIRSLQIHYDNFIISIDALTDIIYSAEQALKNTENLSVPSRIVHIPLSWDDEACRIAIQKYMQSVRKDAPWCPDNIEFIRRINGLESIEDVKKIVFDAHYVVMGLGDVYLGAPVATPLDPRHRLVTTKYNPARTWTAENSVGIGGSYLCVYGMEGPGGYQFIGRTLQMWNRYRKTKEFSQPWLLRFFDQIKFYEVSAEELQDIREKFPRGDYPLNIEETQFDLNTYQDFLDENANSISSFTDKRDSAFDEELERWVASGQINFEISDSIDDTPEESDIPDDCEAIESHIAGSIWQWKKEPGQTIDTGDVLCVLESMKMEIEITAPTSGKVIDIRKQQGQQVLPGQVLAIVQPV